MPISQDKSVAGTPTDEAVKSTEAEVKAEPKTSTQAVVEALGIGAEKEPVAEAEPADEQAPDSKEDVTAPETEASPVKDEADEVEIPKDITNPKSQERFRALTTQIKEKDQQLATVRKDVEDFRVLIQESTSSPKEFVQLLDYSKAVKSGDFERALSLLDAQRAALARAAGLDVEGVDVFSEHPDLKQRVDGMELDKASALELVRRRNQDKAAQARAQEEQGRRSTAQQSDVAVSTASAQIADIARKWQGSDIDYRAKHPQLMERAKEIAAEYPPQLWAKALTDYYRTLSVPKAEQKPVLNPLRPSGGSGGNKTPKTSLEAVAASLGIAQ